MKKSILMLAVVLLVFSFAAHALPIASPQQGFWDGYVKWWHSLWS
jgi:hypothetical protein